MATDLEKQNIINAINDAPIINSCATCKHYRKRGWFSRWFNKDTCARYLKPGFHPITGKAIIRGQEVDCETERRIDVTDEFDWYCGHDGRSWEKKDG